MHSSTNTEVEFVGFFGIGCGVETNPNGGNAIEVVFMPDRRLNGQ